MPNNVKVFDRIIILFQHNMHMPYWSLQVNTDYFLKNLVFPVMKHFYPAIILS